jgi:hypothetical protein
MLLFCIYFSIICNKMNNTLNNDIKNNILNNDINYIETILTRLMRQEVYDYNRLQNLLSKKINIYGVFQYKHMRFFMFSIYVIVLYVLGFIPELLNQYYTTTARAIVYFVSLIILNLIYLIIFQGFLYYDIFYIQYVANPHIFKIFTVKKYIQETQKYFLKFCFLFLCIFFLGLNIYMSLWAPKFFKKQNKKILIHIMIIFSQILILYVFLSFIFFCIYKLNLNI